MVRLAIVGCAHGRLENIYATVRQINAIDPDNTIQLLICCGDFQCMRNAADLENLACPPKYREMHTFHQYYTGSKQAPVLTIFIGGNHEASSYLVDLPYGGYVAPNIFYLGYAGVIRVAGLRIAGISGIYKEYDYRKGHYESNPLNDRTMRSVYHMRQLYVYQLSHLLQCDKDAIDIFLSHDWPRGIEQFGNLRNLLRKKPYFKEEIQANTLGNPATEILLQILRPEFWFAAHLHVKFPALYPHLSTNVSEHQAACPPGEKPAEIVTRQTTKFLALDKCLPRHEFLQVLEIENGKECPNSFCIEHDLEWLAILRATHYLESKSETEVSLPRETLKVGQADLDYIKECVRAKNEKSGGISELAWVTSFTQTVAAMEDVQSVLPYVRFGNPQTDEILRMLGLHHVITPPYFIEDVKDPNAIDLE